jgi:3-hydroxyisobutyrate dehydrogenase
MMVGDDREQIYSSKVAFIGLGKMGLPIALNMARAGTSLTVWNRTSSRCEPLSSMGAKIAPTVPDAFEQADTVVLMLFDGHAIDSVLRRGEAEFPRLVTRHTIVNMSSVSPQYSRALAVDIQRAGGRYVEAPVSGSRIPAEKAELVVMLAGEKCILEAVKPMLRPTCRHMIECGPIGNALLIKLTVNHFLIVTLTGLSETVHLAQHLGLDLDLVGTVLNASQLASDVSRIKVQKLINRDFSPQAAMSDASNSANMILEAARAAKVSIGLLEHCRALYAETISAGRQNDDMVAVIHAMETHSARLSMCESPSL